MALSKEDKIKVLDSHNWDIDQLVEKIAFQEGEIEKLENEVYDLKEERAKKM